MEEEFIKEKLLSDYLIPITIEQTKTILEQLKKCICKIKKVNGTGFFCIIPCKENNIRALITNYHVINHNYIENNAIIELTINDDKTNVDIIISEDRKIYLNEEYDIAIIEIKNKDKINNFLNSDDDYLKLDDNLFKENSESFYDDKNSIYILQYPKSYKACVSYGTVKDFKNYDINYYCSTEPGASGSPILDLKTNKVFGIHKQSQRYFNFNSGTFLKYPLNDFNEKSSDCNYKKIKNNSFKTINEIKIKIEVDNKNINKKVFFLGDNNKDDIYLKKFFSEKLNENNIDLYIDDSKYEFKKYFIPEREGYYDIKLKFKYLVQDCSFMFENCSNIIMIDLSLFNTNIVCDMNHMFAGCENLIKIDLTNFTTKNVVDMKYMFYKCSKLKSIDLSNFNTKYVTSMNSMFSECINLKTADISNFVIKDFTNVEYMFEYCYNLDEIDVSIYNDYTIFSMFKNRKYNKTYVETKKEKMDIFNKRMATDLGFADAIRMWGMHKLFKISIDKKVKEDKNEFMKLQIKCISEVIANHIKYQYIDLFKKMKKENSVIIINEKEKEALKEKEEIKKQEELKKRELKKQEN